MRRFYAVLLALLPTFSFAQQASPYSDLVNLFTEWRAFEHPAIHNHVPDYSAPAMAAQAAELPRWQKRLAAIHTTGWTPQQLNDLKLVRAEMNGLDFNLRVLRPWARDPAFYVNVLPARSDVPSREGPIIHPYTELYKFHFPLSPEDQKTLTASFSAIPVLLAQARENLNDSNARDLWIFGEEELRTQSRDLADLEANKLTVSTLEGSQLADLTGADPALHIAIDNARKATDEFVAWLEKLATTRTGPSGVGKENYTWYQQNVHFIPWTWDEEVTLLRRELERAQAALRLEEQRNRNLPQLEPAVDAAAFDNLTSTHLDKFVDFLVTHQIIPDKPYLKAALEPQRGHFIPEDQRIFFTRVTHREPMLLYSHDYHWIDLARMRDEPNPSPIRRVISLSNIWDNRAEGFATAFEEIIMHAGLYDDNPRAKELVWIMLANRAARGLASLYVQANEMNLEQAARFHSQWTPRGWSKLDQLTGFEQLLYLRQPGYGASYINGKLLFDRLMTEYSRQQEIAGKPFVLRDFMDKFNSEGMIPIALMEDELIPPEAREP
jgi:uncharacterized protein (DUF885 family)